MSLEHGAYDLHMVSLISLPPDYFIKTENCLLFWCWLTNLVTEKGY